MGATVTIMAKTPTELNKVRPTVQKTIEHITASGQMTRFQHLDLTSALLSDLFTTECDREKINQILESVQLGKLQLRD